ncbi:flagellar hook-basal body complex protein [Pararhodobacter aggregans]|uniref:Flagellar basal-body rod protein FlgF n=1 Tax=Pararhodobacter aggregans TaxID=404875 RepID=A0A2T7URV9_9RHOB|nr:flagellar hook-basal body complex protein [Pararhodobacter aggregans]PTX00405.1 flagellar basal-body rod protein FlgF [Pararhodobacter aggregans]PVE47382.1 flagellar basal-body rod protein FlgF [Pararhodobacter aggregans]
MDNAGYTQLTRQSGLLREIQMIAHNIANLSTTGFRREGLLFSEYVERLGGEEPSLSMATGRAHQTYLTQGTLTMTGGPLDLAVEGEGFFTIQTPEGERYTRAGHFTPNQDGELVTPDGHRVLDDGGSAIFIPPDAGQIAIARDGTVSADGQPLAQIALVMPDDPADLRRETGVLHSIDGEVRPVEMPQILQGFLEESNVNAISEMARLIAVQRAYENGQKFLDREDERIRNVVQTLGR